MSTSVHGPFPVSTRRVNTGVLVNVGDTIRTTSTGLLDLGGAVAGVGAPILDADGDDWSVPPNYPAPNLRKNSLICKTGSTWYQGGVNQSFTPSESGYLILYVNDANPGDNSRQWNVTVYQTPPGEAVPNAGPWGFETVDGAGGILGANVGGDVSAVSVALQEHVFYCDGVDFSDVAHNHVLRHRSQSSVPPTNPSIENIDGNGGPNGRTTHGVASWQNCAVVLDDTVHVFYSEFYFDPDGIRRANLRHAWNAPGADWQFEIVDGEGGPDGQVEGIVGATISAVVHNWPTSNHIHVFYSASGQLRHAVWDTPGWRFETVDGAGGADGRVDHHVAEHVRAVAHPWVDRIYVFYTESVSVVGTDGETENVASNLRLARLFGCTSWNFETLDGAGGPDGRTKARVGMFPTAIFHDEELHVFYHDITYGNIRHAVFDRSRTNWRFELLDGGGGPNGRTKHEVGRGVSSAVSMPDQLSFFYYDRTAGNLRHAFWMGANWTFETLDGDGGTSARIMEDVGHNTSALINIVGEIVVYYTDQSNSDIRRAVRAPK